MKTTVEISDALLKRARTLGQREGTTLRALVEQGLQYVLARRTKESGARIESRVFEGERGFTGEFVGASWNKIKDESRRR